MEDAIKDFIIRMEAMRLAFEVIEKQGGKIVDGKFVSKDMAIISGGVLGVVINDITQVLVIETMVKEGTITREQALQLSSSKEEKISSSFNT